MCVCEYMHACVCVCVCECAYLLLHQSLRAGVQLRKPDAHPGGVLQKLLAALGHAPVCACVCVCVCVRERQCTCVHMCVPLLASARVFGSACVSERAGERLCAHVCVFACVCVCLAAPLLCAVQVLPPEGIHAVLEALLNETARQNGRECACLCVCALAKARERERKVGGVCSRVCVCVCV